MTDEAINKLADTMQQVMRAKVYCVGRHPRFTHTDGLLYLSDSIEKLAQAIEKLAAAVTDETPCEPDHIDDHYAAKLRKLKD